MTSENPVQRSYQLSYEATLLRPGPFVGLNICELSDSCASAVVNSENQA